MGSKLASGTARDLTARGGGYSHPLYAQSLAEFGKARHLPLCDGWVLVRRIPGCSERDAMGCYPYFSCGNWDALGEDLEALGNEIVSLSLVADPFGDHHSELLSTCFPDVCVPFKDHFVVDLDEPSETFVSRAHRRNANKGLQRVSVERCEKPRNFLEDWNRLYANLIARHRISGLVAFSRSSFAIQLQVPGLVAFRAHRDGTTVGMLLWYLQGQVAHYHLGAFDRMGYESLASFALFWRAIEFFRSEGLRWLNLGGGAGVDISADSGIARFKSGWASTTRPAYFCGRTFDPRRSAELAALHPSGAGGYFPSYRAGEFG